MAIALLVLGTATTAYAQPEGEPDPEGYGDEAGGDEAAAGDEGYAEPAPEPEPEPAPMPEPAPEPAPPADAAAGPGLVVTGSFFTRYELRHNYDQIGRIGIRFGEMDAFFYRARLGLATTPIDVGEGRAVILSMAPQSSGVWGPSGALADADVGLHEAKMRIKGAANWLDLGRFEMIYGDHLVIGNVGWHQTGRTFDGARVHMGLGDKGAWVDAFLTMIGEGTTLGTATSFGESDLYFTGVYAGLGPNFGAGTDLDGYLLLHIAPAAENDPVAPRDYSLYQATLGARLKKQVGQIGLRAEGGLQFGKLGENGAGDSIGQLAYHIDADGSFKASDKLTLIVGALFASGDDPTTEDIEAWDQLYPTAHKFLGFMDVIGGRSNIMGANAKARFAVDPKLSVAGDLHFFLRPETPDGVDSYSGIEADLWTMYKLGKGLGLRCQYAAFVPNDGGEYGTDELIHYVEIQLGFELK